MQGQIGSREMDDQQKTHLEAAAFRRLVKLLQVRTDVQNIDLMGTGGFCRNCLADWLAEAAHEAGLPLDKAASRDWVYGMPQDAFKAQYQRPSTPEQMDKMNASVAKNRALGL
jgi:uncharacterized protein